MNLTLPIPVKYNDRLIADCIIKGYTAGVLADTKKSLENENPYKAYSIFLSGCIESLEEFVDKQTIREIVGNMSYKTAEYLTVKILALDDEDDGIEGMYSCPRCGKQIISEKNGDTDTRDFIKDLVVNYLEDGENFLVKLQNNIEIKDIADDELIQIAESLEFRHPSLKDCINAFVKYGKKDIARLQIAIYLESLVKVNNQIISDKFKFRYGMQILEDMTKKDLRELNEKINRYGLNNSVIKTCIDCGKEFEVLVNTSNFFVSALR